MNKVAVIMSVYRTDKLDYMKSAVDSILNQSYGNFIFYIYRDGPVSEDIQEYLDFLTISNNKIEIVTSEINQGLAVGLNTLINKVVEEGKFEFIARMDSDDISHLERLNRQVYFMLSNSAVDVCGTSCKEFGASFALEEKHLPKTHDELVDFSVARCPFIHPSVMFRASVFESGVRYPTNTALTEDMALWFELLVHGYKFANINEILLDYRLNENTINRRKGFGKAVSEVSMRRKYMSSLGKVSVKNVFLVWSRIIFHVLPKAILKVAYKKAR